MSTANDFWRPPVAKPPYFIPAQHPKASLAPDRATVARMIAMGYTAQRKVNGARAQVHVSAEGEVVAFTRQGTRHTEAFPPQLKAYLAERYAPEAGWNVYDAEWQRQEDDRRGKLYLFDLIVLNNKPLDSATFEERHEILAGRFVLGPMLGLLPVLTTVAACMAVLEDPSPFTEGLVFRTPKCSGFHNSSLLRCRKTGMFFEPAKLS